MTTLKAHEQGDNLIVTYHADVEPILKSAHDQRRADAEDRTAFGVRREFRKTMSIPPVIMLQVCEKLGIPFGEVFNKEHQARIAAELKGPDYKAFRCVTDRKI
jgi:hypothetical protein